MFLMRLFHETTPVAISTLARVKSRTAMTEMFEASRVPSGHGFPAMAKNPQPDGMRLAKLSSWAARDINLTRPKLTHSRLLIFRLIFARAS